MSGSKKELLELCNGIKGTNYDNPEGLEITTLEYVTRVRNYHKTMSLAEVVNLEVDKGIKDGILKEFLLANKAEVTSMSIFEYDE